MSHEPQCCEHTLQHGQYPGALLSKTSRLYQIGYDLATIRENIAIFVNKERFNGNKNFVNIRPNQIIELQARSMKSGPVPNSCTLSVIRTLQGSVNNILVPCRWENPTQLHGQVQPDSSPSACTSGPETGGESSEGDSLCDRLAMPSFCQKEKGGMQEYQVQQ